MSAEEGAEAAEAASNPVIPDVAEMFWGAIAFLGLWALMRYVLLPPVQKVMAARQEAQRSELEAAQRAVAEAEKVRRDYDQTLNEARAAAGRTIDEARAEADTRRSELIAAAEAQVAEARAAALAEVAATRQQALAHARPEVAALAADAASRVLGRQVPASAAEGVVDELLASAR
jgi:F-type H+-transporting ATPase subunit b